MIENTKNRGVGSGGQVGGGGGDFNPERKFPEMFPRENNICIPLFEPHLFRKSCW